MVTFLMIAIVALIAFLCVASAIPGVTRDR
jgi:hypothetical protein